MHDDAADLSDDATAGKAVGTQLQPYHAAANNFRTALPASCSGDRRLKVQWIIAQLGAAA